MSTIVFRGTGRFLIYNRKVCSTQPFDVIRKGSLLIFRSTRETSQQLFETNFTISRIITEDKTQVKIDLLETPNLTLVSRRWSKIFGPGHRFDDLNITTHEFSYVGDFYTKMFTGHAKGDSQINDIKALIVNQQLAEPNARIFKYISEYFRFNYRYLISGKYR